MVMFVAAQETFTVPFVPPNGNVALVALLVI